MLEIVFELRNMEKTWGKKIVVKKELLRELGSRDNNFF